MVGRIEMQHMMQVAIILLAYQELLWQIEVVMRIGFLKELVLLQFQLHQQDTQQIIPMNIQLALVKLQDIRFHFLMEDIGIIQGH